MSLLYQIKYPFKRLAYECLDRWVLATVPYTPRGKVLLTRLDLIGDYLMCRPFFQALKEGSEWKEKDWFFAGNQQVRALSEHLDGKVFSNGIWVDRARFINSIGYRYKILKQVRQQGFEVAINLSHTRQFWLESLVRVSGAKETIRSSGTGRYMSSSEEILTESWYSRVVNSPEDAVFEFYRNRLFFKAISPKAGEVNTLVAAPKPLRPEGPLRIFLAPGASTAERQWPVLHFAATIRQLNGLAAMEFILLGGPAEKSLGQQLEEALPDIQIRNQIGKWSLVESLNALASADLLIANESGPVHMAATSGTACVCISNGNHFGRWNPYPKELAPEILTVYPTSFEPREEKFEDLVRLYHLRSSIPASEVPVKSVFEAAVRLLKAKGLLNSGG